MAGGRNSSGFLASAELYDTGLGFNEVWRPVLSSVSSSLPLADALVTLGSQFKGIGEASGGTTQSSPTNYPLVQIRSLTNEQTRFLPVDAVAGI